MVCVVACKPLHTELGLHPLLRHQLDSSFSIFLPTCSSHLPAWLTDLPCLTACPVLPT